MVNVDRILRVGVISTKTFGYAKKASILSGIVANKIIVS